MLVENVGQLVYTIVLYIDVAIYFIYVLLYLELTISLEVWGMLKTKMHINLCVLKQNLKYGLNLKIYGKFMDFK